MNDRPLWRLIAGRKAGPYEPAKLRPLVKDGRIGPLDRFSYDGVTWGPVTDFPELLRSPARAGASAGSSPAFDPLDVDGEGIDMSGPIDVEPPVTVRRRSSWSDTEVIDDAKLIKAISMLIAFGGGMFVLLIGYIVIASLWRSTAPGPVPVAGDAQAATPADTRPPAAAPVREANPPSMVDREPISVAADAAADVAPPAAADEPAAEPEDQVEPAPDASDDVVTESLE